MATIEEAERAIGRYAYGMDTSDRTYATEVYADDVDIDHRQVGAMQARTSRAEIADFLQGLLGKPDLNVHTAISQVLDHPEGNDRFVAYYSVRHYKGPVGPADKFALGWYDFRMAGGRISSITVNVTATAGSPAVLA